jgi:lipopolysaccharide/colanic/teichoic acid biosynthesis glycosyltransferase
MSYPRELPLEKRVFDLAITIPLLVLLSPIMLVVVLMIRIRMGKPVLFHQIRPGYKGALINVVKFRSMSSDVDESGNFLPDDERLTPLGKFIRNWSIDELPELFNVIKGEMSLVGPRPLLVEYLDRYNDDQMRRHNVLPGITGWSQIHGRNLISWQEKFIYDVWYVDHWSLWLDIKILTITLWKVIRREGISQEGFATAPVFMGNEKDPE